MPIFCLSSGLDVRFLLNTLFKNCLPKEKVGLHCHLGRTGLPWSPILFGLTQNSKFDRNWPAEWRATWTLSTWVNLSTETIGLMGHVRRLQRLRALQQQPQQRQKQLLSVAAITTHAAMRGLVQPKWSRCLRYVFMPTLLQQMIDCPTLQPSMIRPSPPFWQHSVCSLVQVVMGNNLIWYALYETALKPIWSSVGFRYLFNIYRELVVTVLSPSHIRK